jgi:hypothetical protein
MKTLVCVIGQIRHETVTWDAFERNVLRALNADLVTCGADMDSVFRRHALLHIPSDPQPIEGARTNGHYVVAHRKNLYTNLVHSGLVALYDQFVVTRADHVWTRAHPELDTDHVWFMNCEFHLGISDRHVVVPQHMLRETLVYQESYDESKYRNIESFLYSQVRWGPKTALAYFPMFLCDHDGRPRRLDEFDAPRENFTWPFYIDHGFLSVHGMFCGRLRPVGPVGSSCDRDQWDP